MSHPVPVIRVSTKEAAIAAFRAFDALGYGWCGLSLERTLNDYETWESASHYTYLALYGRGYLQFVNDENASAGLRKRDYVLLNSPRHCVEYAKYVGLVNQDQ